MSRWPKVRAGSQNERILDALQAAGGWITTQQIHRAAGFSRLNSRIAELNRRGYLIEHEGEGGGAERHRYRLLGEPLEALLDETPGLRERAAGVSSSGGYSAAPAPPPGVQSIPPLGPSQLSLLEVQR